MVLSFKSIFEMEKLADKVELGLKLYLEAMTSSGEDVNFAWAGHLYGMSDKVAWKWAAAYQRCLPSRIALYIN